MKLILIVDDDPSLGRLLEFALQKAGFGVMIARDGKEGLKLASEFHPDAAILDVMMPGVHGYELCRRLRADPGTAHTKVVCLTARSQAIDEQEARKAGADLFLSKPIMPEDLIAHIRSLLLEEETAGAVPTPEPRSAAPEEREVAPHPREELPRRAGRLIVCFSPTPDVGVTTLAVNLALGLAASLHTQIPLIELHANQDDLLPAMGMRPDPHRGNLSATGQVVNWDTLLLHLIDHPSGVRVLPAAPPTASPSPAAVEQAVAVLQDRFPAIVIDAAPSPDELIRPILLKADLILLVIAPDVLAIRAMLQAAQALAALGYPERQILLVVNNVHPKPEVPVEKLAEGIKKPILAVIPFEPTMEQARASGRPLLALRPKSPASQSLARIAMQLSRAFALAP